jgi:hypothetical protein
MAAGLGFKDFTTGEVLTANDVDGYLMQGVWVFADAAARDAAVTSPQEGNFAYLKDTNVTTYYTGSAWANLDTTGMTNPMTTTGDTIYSSSGSTPARLAIGTAGQVLTVNSGATAPEWKTSTAEKSILVAQNSANYLKPFTTVALSSSTATEDVTYFQPIYLPGYAIDRISCRTHSTFSGTATVRLGLYNASSTTGKPNTVYLDAGTVSCTAASTNYEITVSNTPPAGYYYFAFNMQTAATTNEFAALANANTPLPYFMPTTASVNTTTYFARYEETGITGAFATAGTITISTSNPFLMAVRIA